MSPANPSNSEWLTRKARIDPRLKALGWLPTPYSAGKPLSAYGTCAIEEYPTDNGPADYALCMGGQIVGIVEAKKLSLGPQNVLTQAERYSKGATSNPLNFNGFRVPFLYSTNGEVIWFHDVRHPLNRSRQTAGYHTPAALAEMLSRDFAKECEWFVNTPNSNSRLRPYQQDANAATEKAILDRKRQMLLAMATGTGKTLMTVNQAYRLMKSGVGKRVLFLVDRRALAAQAVRAFASFDAEPGLKFDKIYEVYSQKFAKEDLGDGDTFDPKALPASYLTSPQASLAFVYVSTIQRMAINLFGKDAVFSGDEETDDDAAQLDIPIHAFDVIIADECHRGYSTKELSVWRKTLDHFDAIKIGLTATPAANTKAYFKDVVFRYEYERAVREGFLVDYDVVKIKSGVRMNGVFLQEGELVSMIDTATGAQQYDVLEDERQFDTSEVEKKITVPDTNRKILEQIKTYTDAHEQEYDRFPKTLIFADNDLPNTSHCDQLVDQARDVFGRGDSFVAKITGRVDRPLQRIREFRNRPEPGIVVSVDMLTTGVDIPDLEYIVFLRPVKSRILFEQMLGRGTRKGEKYPDKSHFTVFDCFDGTLLAYFKKATGITAEPPESDSKTPAQIIEEIWQNRDRPYNISRLVKRLQRIDKQMSGKARKDFEAFLPDGDVAAYASALPGLLRDKFTETMKTLQNTAFQKLLVEYERPPRTFLVAESVEDEVSSEWLIRGANGQEYKPEDYLAAFADFVKENTAQVEAIEILLKRPRAWKTDALKELRQKLMAAPEGFKVEILQKAHQVTGYKALADIISLVKRAARDEEPLLTAEERVERAISKTFAGQTFTPAQALWVERLRAHLVESLTIDREDFDLIPVFANRGGWARADRDFDGKLDSIIQQINEAIAV